MEVHIYPQTVKDLAERHSDLPSEEPLHIALDEHQILGQKPYLCDLARLEYLLYQSFMTPEYEFRLDMDSLLKDLEIRPQDVVLEISNSLFLLYSSYPIQEIWLNLREDRVIGELTPSDYYYVINSVAGSTGAFLVSPIIFKTLHFISDSRRSLDQLVSTHFNDASPSELEEVLRQILTSGWIQNYQLVDI